MRKVREWLRRFECWFNKGQKRRVLQAGLERDIRPQSEDNLPSGMTPQEARRQARIHLRGLESMMESCKDQRALPLLEHLVLDVRFGACQLRKNPGFTIVALSTLALGIGANTAIFSVVNSVLLRPLPYPRPERLVSVCESNPRLGWSQYVTSLGAFTDWREQASSFEELAGAVVLGPAPMVAGSESELVRVASVSAGFFPLLGIEPLLGRGFLAEEEQPDHGGVVLLSEALWRSRFGANPAVLNREIRLGGRGFTVVGVMPAKLRLFDPSGVQGWDSGFSKCELWRPLPVKSGLAKQRSYRAFLALGRLKAGVGLARAQAEMTAIARRQALQYPASNSGWDVTVRPWSETVVRQARLPLLLLLAAAGLVLLIATANLANLALARAVSRGTEVAVRMSLGAGRARVAGQFLVESLLLSLLGGLAGLLLARAILPLLTGMIPATVPRGGEVSLDGRVLAFTLFTALVVGLLFGLGPILGLGGGDLNAGLSRAGRGSSGKAGGGRWREGLIFSQVALVMILLSGAGLLMRSFWRLNAVDPGFRPRNRVATDVVINGPGYTNGLVRIQAVKRLLDRLAERFPNSTFAAVDGLPLDGGRGNMDVSLSDLEGAPPAGPDEKRIAGLRLASPGYFQTMGIALARGRFLTDRDNAGAAPVVIINEALARRYYSGVDPLGKRISSPDFGTESCEIVGIIKDLHHAGLDVPPTPEVFRPLLQECFSSVTVVSRGEATPSRALKAVRTAAAEVDSDWPVCDARFLADLVGESLAPRRLSLQLMVVFAAVALVLALVGIYGVLSCLVGERVREFGIRLAIGARPFDILAMVLRQGMGPVVLGGLAGAAAAVGVMRILRSMLYDVSPADPLAFIVVAVLLGVVGLAGCWLPARRATKVDPSQALRAE